MFYELNDANPQAILIPGCEATKNEKCQGEWILLQGTVYHTAFKCFNFFTAVQSQLLYQWHFKAKHPINSKFTTP